MKLRDKNSVYDLELRDPKRDGVIIFAIDEDSDNDEVLFEISKKIISDRTRWGPSDKCVVQVKRNIEEVLTACKKASIRCGGAPTNGAYTTGGGNQAIRLTEGDFV